MAHGVVGVLRGIVLTSAIVTHQVSLAGIPNYACEKVSVIYVVPNTLSRAGAAGRLRQPPTVCEHALDVYILPMHGASPYGSVSNCEHSPPAGDSWRGSPQYGRSSNDRGCPQTAWSIRASGQHGASNIETTAGSPVLGG